MALYRDIQRRRADLFDALSYCNPFGPERIEFERELLGEAFIETDYAWHKHPDEVEARPNIQRLTERSRLMSDGARRRIDQRDRPSDADLRRYEAVVLYYLYNKHYDAFVGYIETDSDAVETGPPPKAYRAFADDLKFYFDIPGLHFQSLDESAHLFACFYQLRRAFHQIYERIIGGSKASARLRSAVWESIFTCDMRRARRSLFTRMRDIPTLIIGPSGTGKELVAESIGRSQYVPYDEKKRRFVEHHASSFLPVNLSSLTPTLIESALFGHARGAFTGALSERRGLFSHCTRHGCIFLDELGEIDLSIQVKLLRVLQTRRFHRVGDTQESSFEGKIIAATNRDLAQAMHERRFREDLYYRLCADVIETPALREQLHDAPAQLRNLVAFITRRVAGEDEAAELSAQVVRYIENHLGLGYPWPGNVRELEQCVRNILVRGRYTPPQSEPENETWVDAMRAGQLSADELLNQYAALAYEQTGSYVAAAKRLGLDRRTVKARADQVAGQNPPGSSQAE